MALLSYDEVGISGLAACVPKYVYNNLTDNTHFSHEEAQAIVEKTGIYYRRIASENQCASDLCYEACEYLFSEQKIDRSQIDALIFVSQTPDYRLPGTGIILQDRLGLGQHCACYDVSLGCSGFIIGLSIAFSLVKQPGIRKVLLLNGETRSKAYSFKDRKTGFLFADAGSACLVEEDPKYARSHFLIDSYGSLHQHILTKAGGFRYPSSSESIKEKTYQDGSIRTDEHGVMDGYAVFEFAITEVPKQVKALLKSSEINKEEIDYFVFHQANKFMNNHLINKLKLDPAKCPLSLKNFGNTSSVSIPLTIVSKLFEENQEDARVLLTGFGVGLSVASAIIDLPAKSVVALQEA